MPRQLTCRNEVENGIEDTDVPNIKKALTRTCNSNLFTQVFQVKLFSKFEDKQGNGGMLVEPLFKCLICGCVVNMQKEIEDTQKPNFKIN